MTEYSLPIVPRYAEVDQQTVVFNAHYLTWFDEAVTGYFDHLGASYPDLMSAGLDMQLVHTEIDYAAPVRWRDIVRVAVVCEAGRARRVSRSASRFFRRTRGATSGRGRSPFRRRNVYVVVLHRRLAPSGRYAR